MDHFAYYLVYGEALQPDGPNPEDYLHTIDPKQAPEKLLFPTNKPVATVQSKNEISKKEVEENKSCSQQLQVAIYKPENNQVETKPDPKADLLKYRNPHLLEQSAFNFRDKGFYVNKNGTVMRPLAFADIKFKRPCFYDSSKQFREAYNLGIPLGSGSTSCVRRCENRERANSKCAKMINIDCNRELLNEFNVLKKLYHPLIIDIHEVLEEPKKLYLIEELCMGGDVAHALEARSSYSEEEAAHIIKGVLIAINYLHRKQVIHRNIKPGNFVFKKAGAKMAKLIDFGTAVDLGNKHQKEKIPLSKIVGQPAYMAPEMLKESYNEKVDVWSAGVMLYKLLSNKLPFEASSDQEQMQNILDGSYSFSGPAWRIVKEDAKDLVKQMLTYNPNNRISAYKALKHPWIVKHAPFVPEPQIMNEVIHNMIDCKFQNKIQEAILSMICHRTLNREDLENLENAFLCMDSDFDGLISFDEFKQAYHQYYQPLFAEDQGLSDEDEETTQLVRSAQKGVDIEIVFIRCDLDGDGFIDWHEFLMCACNKHRALSKYNLDEAFYSFDLYQKGSATFDDFECAYGRFDDLGCNVWEDIIINAMDNDDGLLQLEDFYNIMKKIIKP